MSEQSHSLFPFRMAAWLPTCYRAYLRWLRGLLERLGHAAALASWEEACQAAEDGLLRLQRTTTLMEGSAVCDFRIYGAE